LTVNRLHRPLVELIPGGAKTFLSATQALIEATGSSLPTLNGIGPSGAARHLGDVGDVTRFPTRGRS